MTPRLEQELQLVPEKEKKCLEGFYLQATPPAVYFVKDGRQSTYTRESRANTSWNDGVEWSDGGWNNGGGWENSGWTDGG